MDMENYRIELTQASDADGEFVVSEQDRDVIFAVIDECYTLSDRFNFYGSVSFVPTTDDVTPDIDWFEHFGLIDYRDLDSDIDVMVNNLDAESINDAELAGQAAADKIVAAVLAKCPSAQLPELKIGSGHFAIEGLVGAVGEWSTAYENAIRKIYDQQELAGRDERVHDLCAR